MELTQAVRTLIVSAVLGAVLAEVSLFSAQFATPSTRIQAIWVIGARPCQMALLLTDKAGGERKFSLWVKCAVGMNSIIYCYYIGYAYTYTLATCAQDSRG